MKKIKLFMASTLTKLELEINDFIQNQINGCVMDITFHPIVEGEYVFYYASVIYA